MNSIGLYIHIPFCERKCNYCDFFSGKGTESELDAYTDLLIDKFILWSKRLSERVATVYFGGGTPSILGTERLVKLLENIRVHFSVDFNAEITLEVNPDSGKRLDFSLLKKCGFNRISIGFQSALKEELNILGRIHSIADVEKTVEKAHISGFDNISLDLMMGIPLQTTDSLKRSIDFCVKLGAKHISSYILKVEPNTPFYRMKNKLSLPDEDAQSDLYLFAIDYMEKLGYHQYEVSNFAVSGFESRHNTSYWECKQYIGIGPSAHSFYKGRRFYYPRSISDFAADKTVDDGSGGDKNEFVMLALRLKKGLNFKAYTEKFSEPLPPSFIKKAELFTKAGFTAINDERLYFMPKGFLVSNAVISELLDCL